MTPDKDRVQCVRTADPCNKPKIGNGLEEINILKLEGSLFCFDPKEAKRRSGKFTLADARKQPVTILIHSAFGQPSVLSYKVLQASFLKLMETGCTLQRMAIVSTAVKSRSAHASWPC